MSRAITIDGEEWQISANEKIGDKELLLVYRVVVPIESERSPLERWQAESIREPEPPRETSRRTAEWLVGELEKFDDGICTYCGKLLNEARRFIGRRVS